MAIRFTAGKDPASDLLAVAVALVAHRRLGRRSERIDTALATTVEALAPGAVAAAVRSLQEPRWVGDPPGWARHLVTKHALGKVTELTWRRSALKPYSSGRCGYGDRRIVVTASAESAGGTRRADPGTTEQRVVVLHEISHALRPYHGHDDTFYDTFYALLRAEDLYRAGLARGGARSLRAAARRAWAKEQRN